MTGEIEELSKILNKFIASNIPPSSEAGKDELKQVEEGLKMSPEERMKKYKESMGE